ncbi:hypothetical protein ACMHYB_37670 [Sorangium sp. So ce1128]
MIERRREEAEARGHTRSAASHFLRAGAQSIPDAFFFRAGVTWRIPRT